MGGVSFPTDHRATAARFLSRLTISASWRSALAYVSGFSQSIVQ